MNYLCSLSSHQVAGYAVGGGHVLHMVCDLTIAAENAIFGQTGPKVLFFNPLSPCLVVIDLHFHINSTWEYSPMLATFLS